MSGINRMIKANATIRACAASIARAGNRVASIVGITILLAASAACSQDPGTTAPVRETFFVQRGYVTDTAGMPVARVEVQNFTYPNAACTGERHYHTGRVSTDSSGFYQYEFFLAVGEYCLGTVAAPPAGSGLEQAVVTGKVIEFTHDEYVSVDTLRVDIVLERK